MFFYNYTAPTEISPLSRPDALPICDRLGPRGVERQRAPREHLLEIVPLRHGEAEGSHIIRRARSTRAGGAARDRKSTRLNSSHANMSYAVFCLKKTIICINNIQLII